MTDARAVRSGTTGKQSGTNGKQSDENDDVVLPPRIQQVADIIAESIARNIRETNTKAEQS